MEFLVIVLVIGIYFFLKGKLDDNDQGRFNNFDVSNLSKEECLSEIKQIIKGISILSAKFAEETGDIEYEVVCADMLKFSMLMEENSDDAPLALVCSHLTLEIAELYKNGQSGYYDFLYNVYHKIVDPKLMPVALRLLELNGGKPTAEDRKRVDVLFDRFDFKERL